MKIYHIAVYFKLVDLVLNNRYIFDRCTNILCFISFQAHPNLSTTFLHLVSLEYYLGLAKSEYDRETRINFYCNNEENSVKFNDSFDGQYF